MKPLQTQMAKLFWSGTKQRQEESLKWGDLKVKERFDHSRELDHGGNSSFIYIFISQEIVKCKRLFSYMD